MPRPRVVLDLEATCWDVEDDPALAANQRNECEVIEIGAVRLPLEDAPSSSFRAVVRPRRHPTLSTFCTTLTGLTQAEVDAGMSFPEALERFVAWADPCAQTRNASESLVVATWGAWDHRQLLREAGRHRLAPPTWEALNIKRVFRKVAGPRGAPRGGWLGLHAALEWLGLAFEGEAHRAVDDARNAARVLAWVERPSTEQATLRSPYPRFEQE